MQRLSGCGARAEPSAGQYRAGSLEVGRPQVLQQTRSAVDLGMPLTPLESPLLHLQKGDDSVWMAELLGRLQETLCPFHSPFPSPPPIPVAEVCLGKSLVRRGVEW